MQISPQNEDKTKILFIEKESNQDIFTIHSEFLYANTIRYHYPKTKSNRYSTQSDNWFKWWHWNDMHSRFSKPVNLITDVNNSLDLPTAMNIRPSDNYSSNKMELFQFDRCEREEERRKKTWYELDLDIRATISTDLVFHSTNICHMNIKLCMEFVLARKKLWKKNIGLIIFVKAFVFIVNINRGVCHRRVRLHEHEISLMTEMTRFFSLVLVCVSLFFHVVVNKYLENHG